MLADHPCHAPNCFHMASGECATCDRLYCRRHLITVQVVTNFISFPASLCPGCLVQEAQTPSIEGYLAIGDFTYIK